MNSNETPTPRDIIYRNMETAALLESLRQDRESLRDQLTAAQESSRVASMALGVEQTKAEALREMVRVLRDGAAHVIRHGLTPCLELESLKQALAITPETIASELAELREDKARIDELISVQDNAFSHTFHIAYIQPAYGNLRAAIDAARKATS